MILFRNHPTSVSENFDLGFVSDLSPFVKELLCPHSTSVGGHLVLASSSFVRVNSDFDLVLILSNFPGTFPRLEVILFPEVVLSFFGGCPDGHDGHDGHDDHDDRDDHDDHGDHDTLRPVVAKRVHSTLRKFTTRFMPTRHHFNQISSSPA